MRSELLALAINAENLLSELLMLVLNAAMKLERQHNLRADHHERTDDRYQASDFEHC